MSQSIVIAPYAKNVAEFVIRRDGELDWRTYTSIEEAIKEAFAPYAWPGGAPIAYQVYDEYGTSCSDYMCAECIQRMYYENNHSDSDDVIAGRVSAEILEPSMYSCGVTCENCNDYIIEPFCADCGREESHEFFSAPFFYSEQSNQQICARCMAGMVVANNDTPIYGNVRHATAYKMAGINTYWINQSGAPWYGHGIFRAFSTRKEVE